MHQWITYDGLRPPKPQATGSNPVGRTTHMALGGACWRFLARLGRKGALGREAREIAPCGHGTPSRATEGQLSLQSALQLKRPEFAPHTDPRGLFPGGDPSEM